MNEKDIEILVRRIISEMKPPREQAESLPDPGDDSGETLPDLMERDKASGILVPHPADEAGLAAMVASTPARIGVGRAGPRPKTEHWLRFRADHAAANDAVLSEVDLDMVERLGFFTVSSRASSKDEFLTRPDLGRLLSPEGEKRVREECPKGADVQLVMADGLSSAAITANAPDFIPAFEEMLRGYGLATGKKFFVRYGRVGLINAVGEILAPKVVLLLIGERPGLVTASSMSAYMCYAPSAKTIESERTLVANIHRGGIPAVEAAAHVAETVKRIFDMKASGLKLRALSEGAGS